MAYTRRDSPAAYLLTWTTYGTWLHGDDRGSIARHSPGATRLVAPDRGWVCAESASLASPPLLLNDEMRAIASAVIRNHAERRGWSVHALNARTNHVHAVVSGDDEPERMMSQFKSWITRRLREAKLIEGGRRVWTRHGSTRYLWDPDSVAHAVRYVRDMQ